MYFAERATFFHLQNGSCFCFSQLHSPLLSNRQCNVPCPGDNAQLCGGKGAISVYNLKTSNGTNFYCYMMPGTLFKTDFKLVTGF